MPAGSSGRIVHNVVANYLYVAVMGCVTILFTPIYVRVLGPTEWGFVAVCMTIQGALLLLDAGLSQVLPAAFSKARTGGNIKATFAAASKIYLVIAASLLILGLGTAPFLAAKLAQVPADGRGQLAQAIQLLCVQVFFQLQNSAALAYWNGTEQQRLANVRAASFGLCKHCVALALVLLWSPTILAYMAPFALVSTAEFVLNRRRVTRELRVLPRDGRDVSARDLLPQVGGFTVAVTLGILSSQLDRLVLVQALSVEQFGEYVLVANFALVLMHLHAPLQRAFIPQIAVAKKRLRLLLARMTAAMLVLAAGPCVLAAVFAVPLLQAWLGNAEIAIRGAPVFQIIAIAVAINGLYGTAYSMFVRENQYGRVIVLNSAILSVQLIILLYSPLSGSALSGAVAWLAGSTMQLIFGMAAVVWSWRARPSLRGAH